MSLGSSVHLALHSSELWPTILTNWSSWSIFHLFTFSCVPLEYRVLAAGLKRTLCGEGSSVPWRTELRKAKDHLDQDSKRAISYAYTSGFPASALASGASSS